MDDIRSLASVSVTRFTKLPPSHVISKLFTDTRGCGQEYAVGAAALSVRYDPAARVVERTMAWLNRCRRLTKEWKCLNRRTLAFLQWASSAMLRRLCQKTS